jgi:hypothetical protein
VFHHLFPSLHLSQHYCITLSHFSLYVIRYWPIVGQISISKEHTVSIFRATYKSTQHYYPEYSIFPQNTGLYLQVQNTNTDIFTAMWTLYLIPYTFIDIQWQTQILRKNLHK